MTTTEILSALPLVSKIGITLLMAVPIFLLCAVIWALLRPERQHIASTLAAWVGRITKPKR